MEKAKQSGCVLVAEAARPNGDLISARKGNAKYRITFHGKASHAGSALTEGVSAITELAHWVLAINEQVNLDTGTTMNVGVVQGDRRQRGAGFCRGDRRLALLEQ